MEIQFDCIIIGGGATGAGIARDLSLRGLKVILFEKDDLSEGTTGRCHAMLHSGARYVLKDKEAAEECANESKILLKIAPHISELCGGYFIGINQEDLEYGAKFENLCKNAAVQCEEIRIDNLFRNEPNVNQNTKKAFKVQDGYIDPFLLTMYNAYDAKLNGAEIKTYHEVQNLILDEKHIKGVEVWNKLKNQKEKYFAKITINATGPWSAALEQKLNLKSKLKIAPTMGTLIVIKDRIVNSLINRLRKPGDGDIFVPSHNSVILGTTSKEVPINQLNHLHTNKDELEYLIKLGEELIPTLRNHRIIRFYSGARPLISSGGPSREASRKFDIIDYENEGYFGFLTIFGGKLTTYRLMAEKICDLVCQKLNIKEKCSTDKLVLPGGERIIPADEIQNFLHIDSKTAFNMSFKWGTYYSEIQDMCLSCMDSISYKGNPRTICECEHVTENEMIWVKDNFDVKVLDDYRKRTRQGMGPCQGQFCFFKVANLESRLTDKKHHQLMAELKLALEKRWKTEPYADEMLKRQIKLSKYMYLMGGNLE